VTPLVVSDSHGKARAIVVIDKARIFSMAYKLIPEQTSRKFA